MHHEDRAGVNALIRGVDDFATGNLPAIVVMCTNRLDALDPAVRRRAAVTFTFNRPNEAQRQAFLQAGTGRAGIQLAANSFPRRRDGRHAWTGVRVHLFGSGAATSSGSVTCGLSFESHHI